MLRFKILFSLSLMGYAVSAQNSGISGYIFDSQTKKPLAEINLILEPAHRTDFSDTTGFFSFTQLSPGNYNLHIRRMGYQPINQQIAVAAHVNIRMDFFLIPSIETLDEIIVSDYSNQNRISALPYIETHFTNSDLRASGSNDVGDFLRGAANINGIKKGGSNIDPVIRGFKFSQLNVQLNNGQKIEGGCPNRMDPATAHVEAEDIERIQIIKGPYALEYGSAFGGLIRIKTKDLPWSREGLIHVQARQGYESNGAGQKTAIRFDGNFKKLFYQFSAGQKNFGNYTDGHSIEIPSSFHHSNYGGKLGFKPTQNQRLSVSYEKSNGWDVRFPSLPMDERIDDTRLMALDYALDSTSGKLYNLKINLYRSDVHHEMDNKYRPFSDTVVAVSAIDALAQGGLIKTSWRMEPMIITAGLDFENTRKDGMRTKNMILQPNLPVKNEKLWNNARINNFGFFALAERKWNRWKWMLSARFDNNRSTSDVISIKHPSLGEIYHYATDSIAAHYKNFSFSFATDYNFSEMVKLSVAAGRGVRSPDLTERFIILLPIGYDQFDYLGNPTLKPEINNQADITFTYTSEKKGILQLNGFYSIVDDYITGQRLPPSVQKPLSKDVLGVKQFYNAGRARLRGFELSYIFPRHDFLSGGLNASFTYGTIDQVKQYVLNDAGKVIDDVILYDDALTEIPPLEGSIFVTAHLAERKLNSQIKIRMVAPQKHVSLASYEHDSPGFIIAGLSMNYQINNWINLIGGVKNMFNTAYYEHLNRNIIGSNQNLYEQGRSFYINLIIDL